MKCIFLTSKIQRINGKIQKIQHVTLKAILKMRMIRKEGTVDYLIQNMIIKVCCFFLTSTNHSGPTLELAVMNKFNGKTREDLIKLVVLQQSTIDMQGKKITDLESYIDGLVSSVIEVAPVLLHKDVKTSNRQDITYIY